jgi:hypothetical protein
MNDKNPKGKLFSRRGILPILGGSLLVPFIGAGQTESENGPLENKEEEYKTLLKPDGTVVKVKISALKDAKIVNKNISNKSFLNWLGKKI